MVSSNPSPRYVKAVTDAFRSGSYGSFGSSKYGDIGATVAAVLLDREARSSTLLADPTHGRLREPLLKVLQLMRALEFSNKYGHAPTPSPTQAPTPKTPYPMALRRAPVCAPHVPRHRGVQKSPYPRGIRADAGALHGRAHDLQRVRVRVSKIPSTRESRRYVVN